MLAALEDQGYRLTSPRRSIINLLDNKEEGFSAEEISRELPDVGRATVYRTIRLLVETRAPVAASGAAVGQGARSASV